MPHLSRAQLRLLNELNREDLIVDELSDDMRYLTECNLAEPLYRPYTEAERSRHRAAGLTVVSRGALNGLKITATGRGELEDILSHQKELHGIARRFWIGFTVNAIISIAALIISIMTAMKTGVL